MLVIKFGDNEFVKVVISCASLRIDIRNLKQTDAAAERRRSHSNLH